MRRWPQGAADMASGPEITERNARLQTRLFEELLDVRRVTSGKLRLEVEQVGPALVVEAAIEPSDLVWTVASVSGRALRLH